MYKVGKYWSYIYSLPNRFIGLISKINLRMHGHVDDCDIDGDQPYEEHYHMDTDTRM